MTKNIFKKFKNCPKCLKTSFTILSHNNDDWFKDIKKCQKEIADLCTNPYYKSNYQKEEFLYWLNIPKWIDEDSRKNKIQSVLDIGCAYGTLSLYSIKKYGCKIFATDFICAYLSKEFIAKYDIRFKINNIELDQLPYEKKFDRIIFTEILEHLFNPLMALKNINMLLSDSGKLYLSTPDAKEWGRITRYYNTYEDIVHNPIINTRMIDDHVYIYNEEELINMLEISGFKIEQLGYSPGVNYRHFNMIVVKKIIEII